MFERNIFSNLNTINASAADIGITVAECAAFSSSIYGASSPPPGWQLMHSHADSYGYAGACYARNLLTTNAQVVFVHRGTVFNFPDIIGNLIGDIELAMEKIPLQVASAGELIQAASAKMIKIYEDAYDANPDADPSPLDLVRYLKSVNTGHSLGAVISDCVAMGIPSITFENPGSKPIIQKILNGMGAPPEAQLEIFSRIKMYYQAYQGGVNLINTCNEQAGGTFRVGKLDYTYKLNLLGVKGFPPSHSYLSEFTYLTDYTADQHSIKKIEQYINEGRSVIEINNPVGFQAGYIEYVNPKNKNYWDGYLGAIWESNSPLAAAIRLKYSNEKEFTEHGYQQLTIVYNDLTKKPILSQSSEKLFDPQLNLFNEKSNNQDVDDIIKDFTLIEKPEQEVQPSRWCSVM